MVYDSLYPIGRGKAVFCKALHFTFKFLVERRRIEGMCRTCLKNENPSKNSRVCCSYFFLPGKQRNTVHVTHRTSIGCIKATF